MMLHSSGVLRSKYVIADAQRHLHISRSLVLTISGEGFQRISAASRHHSEVECMNRWKHKPWTSGHRAAIYSAASSGDLLYLNVERVFDIPD